jgi:hypothetical protein
MLVTQPPVSCICLTYGRPALLEEAIYSFLQQDYAGDKELVVLNDFDQQTLRFDHPAVQVVNVPRRFRSVGEKCNAAVALAAYDLLFVWDDDDICLPHRLSLSVQQFDVSKGFFKPACAWFWNDGVLDGPAGGGFHAQSCWSRELFDLVGGYAAMGNGYDQEIEARFEEARPGSTRAADLGPEQIYYIYRWGGTGSYHMSAFDQSETDLNAEQRPVNDYVQVRVEQGEMRLGEISLEPHWRTDYVALVRRYLVPPR